MIVLGRIVAPFGVKGWLSIRPFGDDPLSWREMPHWWIAPTDNTPAGGWTQYALLACQAHGKNLIASLEGISGRDAAQAMVGGYVAAPREALPGTKEGEYYWGDLVGMTVKNDADETLGEVAGLLSTGAHDVLQVRDGDTERLIPFVAVYVGDVDLARRTIRVAWQKDW
ncbi:MAG: ribosome maturation factor RimM [Azoarcus sp.]|jgi:16S rRNA processing protein RimM|nr:ribosome maturation factor RimM [Azoarcus sp.]